MDGGRTSILNLENMSTKEKSSCQAVNIDKESSCQVKVCKKLTPCPAKGSKETAAKEFNNTSFKRNKNYVNLLILNIYQYYLLHR